MPPRYGPGMLGARHNLGKAQYETGLVDQAVANFRAARAVRTASSLAPHSPR